MLEVRNLAFSYDRPVLRDVSFVVSPGEVVSVIGANGAGKTSLVKVMATLYAPDSGMMLVDGQNAFAHPLRFRRQLGYLSERVALYDDMTVKEFLRYRAELKGEPVRRVRRRVGEAVEACRVSDLLDRPIGMLSFGLRKRVALAEALLLRPRVLLLDDLLTGLDRDMRSVMGTILSEVASFSSVIVTGHEVEDFMKWTTRFLILRDGVISSEVESAGVAIADLRSRVESAISGGAL